MICRDPEKILKVIEDPGVWATSGDDARLGHDAGQMMARYIDALCAAVPPTLYVLMPIEGMLLVGQRENLVSYWSHVYVSTEARRQKTVAAGRDAVAWMWENTPARKIMGLTPACFPHAVLWASALGMQREGTLHKSFLYNGKLYDRILFGIEKD